MLSSFRRQAGFTLIELMVTITMIGILLALGVPTIGTWAADSRVRGAAENLVNGMRLAQATAIGMNRITLFGFTSATPAVNAAVTAGGTNWFIQSLSMNGNTVTTPTLVQSSTMATGYGVSIAGTGASASVGLICFNSFGQQATLSAASVGLSVGCGGLGGNTPTTFLISNSKAVRSFKVLVYPSGQIFMCDALKVQSNTNPDGCP